MHEQLEISQTADGENLVLHVRGELDIATAQILDERLRALIEQHRQIVLDLAELAFIDSTGLAVLVAAAQASERNGADFAIGSASPSVRRLVELAGVGGTLGLGVNQT